MSELIISEMFGMTLQGEGRSQGRPAFFVRLGMCNLDCSWCDTPYTWDWTGKNGTKYSKKDLLHLSIDDILDIIPGDCPRLIITGGEPMIQKKHLIPFIEALPDTMAVEIETNGTLSPAGIPAFVHFNVSPKLPHSGISFDKGINIDVLREFNDLDADFKFVVSREEDIELISDIQHIVEIHGSNIWIMPEGRSADEITAELPQWFSVCADNYWNLSTRLHVLAFNDKRGI
jgi:7-carboxy-7-deazaguanine synthase